MARGAGTSGPTRRAVVATLVGGVGMPLAGRPAAARTRPPANHIAAIVVKNASPAPVANPRVTYFQALAPGDVPRDGSIGVFREGGVIRIAAQQDQEPRWGEDGSYKGAAISFIAPDRFAPGQEIAYHLLALPQPPDRTANLTLARLAAATDFKVQLTGQDLGSDVWQLAVNDIAEHGREWPWGANPTRGWRIVRSGPVCTEWKFSGALRRSGDGAIHRWLSGDIWVRAWGASGPFEIAARIRQSNIFGPTAGGTVGADPQTKHVFAATLLNGARVLAQWGGARDYRAFTLPAGAIDGATGAVALPLSSPIVRNQFSCGVPVTLSSAGSLPGGIRPDRVYWLAVANGERSGYLVPTRSDCQSAPPTNPLKPRTRGSGTIRVVPWMQNFPFTAANLFDENARRIVVNGSPSPMLVQQDFRYLTQRAKAVPPYIETVPVSPLPGAAVAKYSPGSMMYPWDMDQAGDAADDERIGYLSHTGVKSLYRQLDPNLAQQARVLALALAEYHTYLIDETVGQVPVMNKQTYPHMGAPQGGNRSFPYNKFNKPAWASPSPARIDYDGVLEEIGPYMDPSHMPCPWVPPYLATGDDFFRDFGLHLANGATCSNYTPVPVNGVDYDSLMVGSNQTRGMGWGIRLKGMAKHFMPAADPVLPYWTDFLVAEYTYLQQYLRHKTTPNERKRGYYNQSAAADTNGHAADHPFEHQILYLALAMEAWRGEGTKPLEEFLQFYWKYPIGMIDPGEGGCLYCANMYELNLYKDLVVDDAHLIDTWRGVFANTAERGGVLPKRWAGCPAGGINPLPDGAQANAPNAYTNMHAAALALASILGVASALPLYNALRARQYAMHPPLSFADYPKYAIGPLGARR